MNLMKKEPTPPSKNVVFDLGFHNGDDTAFYLHKGYKVIAVEADPTLAEDGMKRFTDAIKSGDLVLLNKAVSNEKGPVDFYINPLHSNLNSLTKEFAESVGGESRHLQVEAISLSDLYAQFGVPFYIKVDIEGADPIVAKDLLRLEKPKYVSFETSRTFYPTIFSALHLAGYTRFQLVNQLNNPTRSGDYKFSNHSSGYFGEDLPKDKWIPFQDMMSRYIKYTDLRDLDKDELSLGWLDIHATF